MERRLFIKEKEVAFFDFNREPLRNCAGKSGEGVQHEKYYIQTRMCGKTIL